MVVLPPCSSALAAILDRCGLDLDITLEFLDERFVGDGDFLADDLIGPVLARGLDAEGVDAGPDRLAVVVLAVPGDGVLPRRPGSARDRVDQVGFVGLPANLVIAIPALQVAVPARAGLPRSGARVPASGRVSPPLSSIQTAT